MDPTKRSTGNKSSAIIFKIKVKNLAHGFEFWIELVVFGVYLLAIYATLPIILNIKDGKFGLSKNCHVSVLRRVSGAKDTLDLLIEFKWSYCRLGGTLLLRIFITVFRNFCELFISHTIIFDGQVTKATIDVNILTNGFFDLKCQLFFDLLHIDLAKGLDL